MKKTGKNLIYSIAYQVLIVIVPLITSPYLARVLGAGKIGIYSYTYSIVFYFMIFAMLGINNYGNRSIAKCMGDKNKINTTFSSIYSIQFILSIIISVLYIIYCIYFSGDYRMISWIQGIYIISNLLDITWYFYGRENFKATVLRNSVVKIISLILILTCVKTKSDLWIYVSIMAGSTAVGQFLLWPSLIKQVKFIKPNWLELKKHIKPILILFIPVLAISAFSYMDKAMLGKMSSMEETGYYENSGKIISIPKALIQAIGAVMLPRAANMLARGQNKEIKKNIETTIIIVMMLTFGCAFGLAAVSNKFSVLFWGEDFISCGNIIALMAPALIFSAFGNVIRTQYLIPVEKDKEYTVSLVLGAVVNIITNLFLIRIFGALGATIGTILAEFTLCFYQCWSIRKEIPVKKYIIEVIPFFIFGLIMFFSVYFISNHLKVSTLNLIIEILVGAFIYTVLLLIYIFSTKNGIINELKIKVKNEISAKFKGGQ